MLAAQSAQSPSVGCKLAIVEFCSAMTNRYDDALRTEFQVKPGARSGELLAETGVSVTGDGSVCDAAAPVVGNVWF